MKNSCARPVTCHPADLLLSEGNRVSAMLQALHCCLRLALITVSFITCVRAQVECPAVTPEMVLKASGHVDRFTDFMVTDIVTHDCHRADHLLKAALEAVKADDKQTPEKKEVRLPCTES